MDVTLVYDREASFRHHRVEAIADALARVGFVDRQVLPAGLPQRAGVIVCDSVATRADDESLYRADRVVALDDMCRDLAVDLVVDPSVGARPESHRRARCVMAGARFIPVKLSTLDYELKKPEEKVEKIVVAVSGKGEIPRLKGSNIALQISNDLPETSVSLLNGRENSDDLTEEIASADLVVTSAGPPIYEALALGRPTVAFALWAHEKRAITGCATMGVSLVAEANTAANTAIKLAQDFELRNDLFQTSRSVVDGMGASRIAAEIARQLNLGAITSNHNQELGPAN